MIKVNGVDIATPKTFSVEINDIDGESERNARGDLVRDRIAVKRKLSLDWGPLTDAQMSVLLNAVKGVFFDVTYPDPQDGIVTKNMYVGNRTAPMYKNGLWESLKMSFVER
jgi:hypothetical protein